MREEGFLFVTLETIARDPESWRVAEGASGMTLAIHLRPSSTIRTGALGNVEYFSIEPTSQRKRLIEAEP
jgi:hypothetical protein